MDVAEIESVRKASPFVPFRIVTADGQEVKVVHPEHIWRIPETRVYHVFDRESYVHRIAADHVTKLLVPQEIETTPDDDIQLKDA